MEIFLIFAVVLLGLLLVLILSGIRFIPNNRVGLVEKRWSFDKGSVKSGLMALNGEAGYQPNILRGGLHYLLPIQYIVHSMPLVTISQGKIGYIFARDGRLLEPSQVLASNATVQNFQDVVAGTAARSAMRRPAFARAAAARGPRRTARTRTGPTCHR